MTGEFIHDPGAEEINRGAELHAYLDRFAQESPGDSGSEVVVAMGRALADRLSPGVVPIGYVLATELFIADCERGVSGIADKPLPPAAVGYPSAIYNVFRLSADGFAHEAFGDAYGQQVRDIRQQVNNGLRESLSQDY